jgi:hypothetical protein
VSPAHEGGQDAATPRDPDGPADAGDSVTGAPDRAAAPPLFVIRGGATAEEVAALALVLQGVAAASAPAPEPEVTSEWAAHHRKLRASYPSGPGGWRSSGLPR